jgi:predicted ATP-dependent endonuclease of OLD family
MKIQTVRIRNFRSIADQTVELQDYTCLVGPNGSGKSNVVHALNVFFAESAIPGLDTRLLSEEDFHDRDTSKPIEITITFSNLSDEAKTDLAHYVRQDRLIVSAAATFDPTTGRAEVKQYGRRLAIRNFAPFFEAEKQGKKVAELKQIYSQIQGNYAELPSPGTKEAMTEALRSFEEGHPERCEEIPSADEFYGVSRGRNLLEKHLQWVYVPAVKEASTEQAEARNTALGQLLARTVRSKVNFKDAIEAIRAGMQKQYEELLANSQNQLEEISQTLKNRLVEWAHEDATLRLKWYQDPEKAVRVDEPFAQAVLGEAGFEGELTRFGHGLQRSFLLAVLHELAGSDAAAGPTMILACEEPELYQHPPQARHLYNVLLKLSSGNSQIIVCTHSPYFVSGEGFESVRLLRKDSGHSTVYRATYAQVSKTISEVTGKPPVKPIGELAKIHQALQPELSEMFFAQRLVFVEGLEDIAYITTYLHLLGLWDEYRRFGYHIIPTDGKSEMQQPLAIAKCLLIPAFVVFDSDAHKPDSNGSREKHRLDNVAILRLCGVTSAEPFPVSHYWGERVVMWASEIGRVVECEIGEHEWAGFRDEVDTQFGHTGGLRKNALHIANSLRRAWDKGKKSASLQKLCVKIMEFGRVNGK